MVIITDLVLNEVNPNSQQNSLQKAKSNSYTSKIFTFQLHGQKPRNAIQTDVHEEGTGQGIHANFKSDVLHISLHRYFCRQMMNSHFSLR